MSASQMILQAGDAAAEAAEPLIATDLGSMYEILMNGGVLMIPIALCSILVIAYFVERLIGLRRGRVAPAKLARSLQESVSAGRIREAEESCEKSKTPLAAIALAGLRMRDGGTRAEMEKAMEDAGLREVTRLRKNVRPLATIASIAPLLGLLGTVLGMIEAFNVVAGGGIGKQELLASGIAKALVTTGAGLTVAIPALAFYHYFSSRVQNLVLLMDDFCSRLLATLPTAPAVATAPTPTAATAAGGSS